MNLNILTRAGLIFATFIGVAAAFSWGDEFTYVTFTDRDLLRGSTFFQDLEFLGSELGSRATRSPGGMMSLILATLQHYLPSAYHIYMFGLICNAFAGLMSAFLLRRISGTTGALAYAALFFTAISILELFWKFWNPSPAIGLSALAYVILLRCLAGTLSARYLVVSGILLSIAAQFHVSFLGGFGLLLAGTIIAAPWRSVRFIPLLITGFLIPFVPFVIADAFRGFEWTIAFLGDDAVSVSRSVECILCALLVIFLKLSGGQIYHAAYVPDVGMPDWFVAGMLNALNMPVLLLACFAVFAIHRLLRRRQNMEGMNRSVTMFLLYMLLVAPIVLLPYASNFNARYYIVFIVPYIAMAAMAFAHLAELGDGNRSASGFRLLTFALAGLLVAKSTIILGYYMSRPSETMSAYSFKRDIIDALHNDWGLSADTISKRASVFVLDSSENKGTWVFHGENHGLDYIAKVRASGITPAHADECVGIVTRKRLTGTPVNVPKDALSALPSAFDYVETRRKNYPNFSVIGFRVPISSNCPRSFVHTYQLSAEQRLIAEALAHVKKDAAPVVLAKADTNTRQYILPYPGTVLPGLMIETKSLIPGGLEIVMRSLNMGGYAASAGRDYVRLDNPAFELQGEDGVILHTSVQGRFGEAGIYTPYRFMISNVPYGQYQLRFTANGYSIDDNVTNGRKADMPRFRVILDQQFEIPRQ